MDSLYWVSAPPVVVISFAVLFPVPMGDPGAVLLTSGLSVKAVERNGGKDELESFGP